MSKGIFAWNTIYIPFQMLIATCLAKTNTLVHRGVLFEWFNFFFLSALCWFKDCVLFVCFSHHDYYLNHHHQFTQQTAFQVVSSNSGSRILHRVPGSYKVLGKYPIPKIYSTPHRLQMQFLLCSWRTTPLTARAAICQVMALLEAPEGWTKPAPATAPSLALHHLSLSWQQFVAPA